MDNIIFDYVLEEEKDPIKNYNWLTKLIIKDIVKNLTGKSNEIDFMKSKILNGSGDLRQIN